MTTTGASGEYLFPSVPDGSNYTITPSLSGYTFSPASESFSDLSGNLVADFMGDKLFSGCATPSFAGPVNYAAGSAPLSVSVGDFNGDGRPDLAVANEGDNNVSILLGNADGTFQTAVNYRVGNSPQSVVVGDFNGDGKPDLAVANNDDRNVSVLLGKGDGTFQTAVNYQVGSNPASVAAGDFNGDGKLDLAVTNRGGSNVSVLLGNGDGTFQTAVNYSVGSHPASVAVGDFNGDGRLDLAVANNFDNNVSVLLGSGDGTFQTAVNYSVGSTPDSVAVGYFNGDGKLDLAVANQISNTISVLLGKGDGTFAAAVSYGAGQGPDSVSVDDFNGDGKPDLVAANIGSNKVSVLLGNGDGTFQMPVNFSVGSAPQAVATGDFNGDGKPDIAVANFEGGENNSGNVSVLLNSCAASDTISGQVTSGGTALSGVNMTLSGSSSATTMTNSSGNYSFTGLAPGGNYTVTPTLTNYTFAPPSSTFNNLSGNQTANFTATLNQYIISGQVASGGTALSGVTMTLSGSAASTTTTNSIGNYSFPGLAAGGNYTVTPSLVNYTFAPPSSTFNNLSGNQTANFTATLNHYAISGQVTSGGKALNGVTITLSGSSMATTTTNASGNYSFPSVAGGGNYIVTPSLANYTFAPPSSTFNNLSRNQTANFTATLNHYSISGQVTSGGKGLSGVTMTLSGSSAATTTTNSGGNYSFANLAAGGSYTITPSLANYTLVPPNKTFTNLSNNQTQNFVGTFVPPLSVVQFSQANYPVTEGCVATTITVLRTGDITKAASVDYETHDGSATEKTNYTYAAGTLEFAANQASQTFPVLLTENGYVQGPTTATIVLSNPVNATLGPIASASLTIADNDTTNNQPNPIDNPGIFACQNYHDFFSRQADQSGEAFWTGQTASCGTDESCLDDKRVNVSAAFFLSIEFQQTGYLVIRIQQESFATLPDYHVFLRETQQIGKGVVVGQAGYQQVLQQNTDSFATEWVARSDFQAKFGKLSNQQYVDTLYANAGVNGPGAEDRNTLISGLNAGTETRASVLLQVANSKEVYNTQYNPAFVLMQYFGYLRRNPQDAPDNNLNGFNFWLNKLNQFSQPGEDVRDSNVALLRVKRAEMVKAFIVSMEYRQRFGEFQTTP